LFAALLGGFFHARVLKGREMGGGLRVQRVMIHMGEGTRLLSPRWSGFPNGRFHMSGVFRRVRNVIHGIVFLILQMGFFKGNKDSERGKDEQKHVWRKERKVECSEPHVHTPLQSAFVQLSSPIAD
jgi:hypothetical protein